MKIPPPHPSLDAWTEQLLAPGPRAVSLDEIADLIGASNVTPLDIEALVDRLIAAGCTVGDEARSSAKESLLIVLKTARALRAELGKSPSVEQIAERSGLTTTEVKGALLFAQVMQR